MTTSLLFVLSSAAAWPAQGFSPEEAARRMTVADGFRVELVACEPLVRQPVAIEFDDRGRLWVIQYLQYPNPAGLRRVSVDRWSRTIYDKVPAPPPRGPAGEDRITILEDLDGDGRADEARDFVGGLNLASGLAFGRGGVFVLNVPYLLFYADKDRDDVPDGEPLVLLEGFGMQDAHSVANSLTWGPDGWLYGTQGSTVTSRIRGIEFQQGVWRYHPSGGEFELFCEGGGNSWGVDFTVHGDLLYATNVGGFVMLHGVQGAYYWKSFTKHGGLHNRHAYGFFDHVPHEGFRGGHVSVGGILYDGEAFPASMRGAYIAADLLGHAVYWHRLEERGTTWRSSHAGELLEANDTWFAPTDVTMGPDGAVYVADWHDRRTAHPDPDATWDRSNGRIFRIRPRGAAPSRAPRGPPVKRRDPRELPSERLVALLEDANGWYARRARRVLADRRDGTTYARLRRLCLTAASDLSSLRALWALHASGGLDAATARQLLDHRSEHVRAWSVRFLGDRRTVPPLEGSRLIRLAREEASLRVRSQLASSAKRLPGAIGLPIVHHLARRDDDRADPFVPLLLWWALERHAVSSIDLAAKLFVEKSSWESATLREVILERLMRRYAAEGSERTLRECARLLVTAPDAGARDLLLSALDEGLASRRAREAGIGMGTLFEGLGRAAAEATSVDDSPPATSPELEGHLARLAATIPTHAILIRTRARLGDARAVERAVERVLDDGAPKEDRRLLLDLLGELRRPRFVEPALRLIESGPPWLRGRAFDVLAGHDAPRIATRVLALYGELDSYLRSKARRLLLGRRQWARLFLDGVDAGEYSKDDVSVDELRGIALHADDRLDALVVKHWGKIAPGTPEEKLAEMRRLANDLRAGSGEPHRGKEIFRRLCAGCHVLFDEGTRVGPDLTHANRQDRAHLLVSMVDPGRVVRREYLASVVATTDGRVLSGLIVERSPSAVTLVDARGERTKIPLDLVARIRDSEVSLMPENLLQQIGPQELRDLFSYLEK